MIQVTKNHYSFNDYNDINRWMSYYYQVVNSICLEGKILIIGKGDGLLEVIIKKFNPLAKIITFDYAEDLEPTVCGNVNNLDAFFDDNEFSAVICCQVLEHLPFIDFKNILYQINRILRINGKLVMSLPDSGICLSFYTHLPKIGDHSCTIKICRFYKKEFKFNGQHYWEINGANKYSLKKIKSTIEAEFKIKDVFLVPQNSYHRFFICEKIM